MNRRFLRPAFVLAAVLAVFGAAAGLTSAAPPADQAVNPAPAAVYQNETCTWRNFGSVTRGTAHGASAYNSDSNTIFTYGGIGTSGNAENDVAQIHFPGPDIANATHGAVAGTASARDYFGSAAAYRNMTVWFFGGGNADGDGTNTIQTLDLSGMSPSWNANINITGGPTDRVFAAAAYSPDHDVIVVNGGAEVCDAAVDDTAGTGCTAGNFQGSSVLTFDAMTGAGSWDRLSGGPSRRFGHTMVYDSTAKRFIVFGGTDDGSRGRPGVEALDVADPDWTNASWGSLATAGTGPTDRFFHSAAFDPAGNRMIIFGGVRANAFANNENGLSDTWALDLGQTPAMWSNLSATEAAAAVGSVMEFDTATGKVILHGGRRSGGDNASSSSFYLDCAVVPATPTSDAVPPTPVTPVTPGTGTSVPPPPTVTPDPRGEQCDWINARVPGAAINAALANQANVFGYGMLCYPSRPAGPYNGLRTHLSLRNAGIPYHPVYNGLVFKCGCP